MTVRPAARTVNAMTVDVEDWFQVHAFDPYIARADWAHLPARVEANTDRILDMFAERDVRATFFVLGWVARRYPALVRRIADAGHEVASHGYGHRRADRQTPEDFRADVRRARMVLEDAAGVAVRGYRAPSFSITDRNVWAFRILAEEGHVYGSSVYPIRGDRYGLGHAPRTPFRPIGDMDFIECPVTTVAVGSRPLPAGGGGYFRLFPYAVSRAALAHVNRAEGCPCVFYFHPWEIDPGQPRRRGLDPKTRFRHYLNLGRMEGRVRALLTDFAWGRLDTLLPGASPAGAGARA